MAWFKRFYDPIILPDGRKLLTLRDAPNISPHCRNPSMTQPIGKS